MGMRSNILANYASQFYVTIIGIVTVPLYIQYMGAEAYGLVGFFAMLQAWFLMLDMGLTPTIARETVGTGSVLIPHAHIGEWSVIGAGTVVNKPIGANKTAVRTPARKIKSRTSGWHEGIPT